MTPLQFARRRKKLFRSQQKAADALGVTQQAISMWETGYREVPLWLVKFMECLDREELLNEMAGGLIHKMLLVESEETPPK